MTEDAPGSLARAARAPVWAHAAVLAVVLLALLPVMKPGSTFTSDEGAYALQARALEEGSWKYDYRAATYDPEGRWFPMVNSTRAGNDFYTYVQHPAYPVLLRVASSVGGRTFGLHLLPLAGAVATAVAAWLLAGMWHPRFSRPAFWMAAASPVIVNGYLLWAHSVSAAVAGLSLVAAAHVARRGLALVPTALAAVGLAAGVLLRSEGVFFAGAVAAAVAVARYVRERDRRHAGLTLAVLGAPAAVALLAERAWTHSIVGDAVQTLRVRGGEEASSYLSGRVTGAWHELFQAHYQDVEASLPATLGFGLAVGLAFLALRRWSDRSRRDLAVAATVGVALYAVRFALYPAEAMTGLLTVWPIALLGLLLAHWRDRDPVNVCALVTIGLFTVGVLATQYPEGGGYEWGGRFFSPLIVPLAVLTAVAIGSRVALLAESRDRVVAWGLVAAVALAPAVVGIATVGTVRARQDDIIAAVARHPAPVTVTTVAGLPRVAWRIDDRVTWMLAEDAKLPELLGSLRAKNVAPVAVVTPVSRSAPALSGYSTSRPVQDADLQDEGLQLHYLE